MQWAAVRTQLGAMRLPPQVWRKLPSFSYCREICREEAIERGGRSQPPGQQLPPQVNFCIRTGASLPAGAAALFLWHCLLTGCPPGPLGVEPGEGRVLGGGELCQWGRGILESQGRPGFLAFAPLTR